MIFRVHYMTTATIPHVYCRLFVAGGPNLTFAAIGSLTMRKNEFAAFETHFDAEFIEDVNEEDKPVEPRELRR
jgi:hypothetical protein